MRCVFLIVCLLVFGGRRGSEAAIHDSKAANQDSQDVVALHGNGWSRS